MKYTRVYADDAGESHYQDMEDELTVQDYAPPAPPFVLSSPSAATGVAFARFPAGWDSDWHPTPWRQFFFVLAGEMEGEASDGTRRRHVAGSAVLLEDTTGQGHRARVVGDVDVRAAVVQLPD